MSTPSEIIQVTTKEAEAWIPPFEQMIGNDLLRAFLSTQERDHAPEGDANVLVEGIPGTGKTVTLLSYLRRRLQSRSLGEKPNEETARWHPRSEANGDLQGWETNIPGRLYKFIRIEGATVTRGHLDCKLDEALYSTADHTFVLLDELGELYFRGMEETLRPLLTAGNITTYATAQNFHSKRRTDTTAQEDDRLRALLRRFSHRFETSNPIPDDLVRYLARRMREWRITFDSPDTLRLLARKSGGIVGYAMRGLIKAIGENERRLSREFVSRIDIDPVFS